MNKGQLVVFSGPSGSGKSTLIHCLRKNFPELEFAVSCTTRGPRKGEEHGREYFFISPEAFETKVDSGEFLEWEGLHDNMYGTPRSELQRLWAADKMPLLDLDVKGALAVKSIEPEALLVFVAPPSVEILEQRLRDRGTESEEQICIRLERVRTEMDKADQFDQRVVNDDLDRATNELEKILNQYMGRTNAHERL